MSTRRLYDTEIGEAIRLHVWQQLKTSLGLKSCNRGSQFNLQGPEPLTVYLPAVRVMFEGVEGERDRPRRAWLGKYTYSVHYLRALADGEDVEVTTRTPTNTIAELFIARADWSLPTWTATAGALLRSIQTTGVDIEVDGPQQEGEVGLGHGTVMVLAECDSFLYTP